jgi:hypothetical protein
LSRVGQPLGAVSSHRGACACGKPGKPFLTIGGEVGYLCLSCFIRDAAGGGGVASRETDQMVRSHKR